jgi:uroporphyrin-III C-methyltransferase
MVSIVGAGPGPADLLTVRALQRIQQAEVVVHDRLLSPEVLDLVPAGAIKIDAGKAPGQHSMLQRDIEDALVRWCRSGKRVVRLKGGDPFVFGRGGEESWALARAGITAEIIPGITAASGCAASTGIPLTHRGLATTCTFVPGQLSEDGQQLDWAVLARPMQTLVFYMAVQNVRLY